MGKCYFNSDWLKDTSYSEWLEQLSEKFKCKYCGQAYLIGSSGIKALNTHMSSQKHMRASASHRGSRSMLSFATKSTPPSSLNQTATSTTSNPTSTTTKQPTLKVADTLKAEIMGRSSSRSKSRSRSGSGGSRSRSGSADKTDRKRRSYSHSPSSDDENKCRVHIADLGLDPSKSEIYRAFEKFGPLREIWVARIPPCFAFVVYKYKDDANEAVRKMDGESLNGKRIRVSIAKPRMKGTRGIPAGGGRNRRCYDCLEFGHLARDCVKGRRRNRSRSRSRDRYERRRSRSRSRSGSRTRRNRSRSRQRGRSGSRDRRRDSRRSTSRGRDTRSARDRSRDRGDRSDARDRKDRSTSRDRDRVEKTDPDGDNKIDRKSGSVDRNQTDSREDRKENNDVKLESSRDRRSESVDGKDGGDKVKSSSPAQGKSASVDRRSSSAERRSTCVDRRSGSEDNTQEQAVQGRKRSGSDCDNSSSGSPPPLKKAANDEENDRTRSPKVGDDSNTFDRDDN